MSRAKRLSTDRLRPTLDLSRLDNTSCSPKEKHDRHSFQPRFVRTLDLALAVSEPGYNVYVAGEPGMGRSSMVRTYLTSASRKASPPQDLVFTYNFAAPSRPDALFLAPGQGRILKQELGQAVRSMRKAIPLHFDQESYARKHDKLVKDLTASREALLDRMEAEAVKNGFSLSVDDNGSLSLFPLVEGKVLTPEEYDKLDSATRKRLKARTDDVMPSIGDLSRQVNREELNFKEKERRLEKESVRAVLQEILDPVRRTFRECPVLGEFFDALQEDVLENLDRFREQDREVSTDSGELLPLTDHFFHRYEVNLFVDNHEQTAPPIVFEDNPTFFNLLGCLEREPEMGTYHTDFTLLKSGSLHRANGGFLMLRIEDVLAHPEAWEGLLRALRSGTSRIEDPTDHNETVRTRTIEPEPIPLHLKVILIGTDEIHELLHFQDERFRKLFKLKAHLQDHIPLTEENLGRYGRFLKCLGLEHKLRPLSVQALSRLATHSCRLTQDQRKLSLDVAALREIMIEADAFAAGEQKTEIDISSLARALRERDYRANLYEEEFLHEYDREAIKVKTSGSAAGCANGLSVSQIGDYVLGLPHQISCVVGVGHGGIMDLEREAELSGPIHTKGMMILKSYMLDRFAHNKPLVLTGSLCFEQSYAHVDGDSASGAELAALLSALSGAPINLEFAFTGAVSQTGAIMAVGEVTRKVEGFFEVCRRRGLTGTQGVLLPEDNVDHLVLNDEVIQAVRDGRFHIHPVATIEEAMELLTGQKAGKRLKSGGFSRGSLYEAVDSRLSELARLAARQGKSPRRSGAKNR
jgi:predicted ATP-dependent protease